MQTILIVEKNSAHAKLAALTLAAAGFAVLRAGDAQEGLQLARIHQPDLVLHDSRPPGMDGLTALRLLRTDPLTQAMKVILVSSFGDRVPQAEVLAAGADVHLAKPYPYMTLPSQVRRLLQRDAAATPVVSKPLQEMHQ